MEPNTKRQGSKRLCAETSGYLVANYLFDNRAKTNYLFLQVNKMGPCHTYFGISSARISTINVQLFIRSLINPRSVLEAYNVYWHDSHETSQRNPK